MYEDNAGSDLAYLDPERGDSFIIASPPQARTVLDVKDRSVGVDRPFITFDFEPDDIEIAYCQHIRRQQERRPESCNVPIDHFDPEGVCRLQARLSEVSLSEYSTATRNPFKNLSAESIPISKPESSGGGERESNDADQVGPAFDDQTQFGASEATLVAASTSRAIRSTTPKQLNATSGLEFAMREILNR